LISPVALMLCPLALSSLNHFRKESSTLLLSILNHFNVSLLLGYDMFHCKLKIWKAFRYHVSVPVFPVHGRCRRWVFVQTINNVIYSALTLNTVILNCFGNSVYEVTGFIYFSTYNEISNIVS
jgi:hypothetical protein